MILGIALCFLMLVLSGGTSWFFTWKQYVIRSEMKQQLKEGVPAHALHYFHTQDPEEAFQWITPSKEFIWNSQVFDVVYEKWLTDGTVEIACVNDEQEERLFRELDVLIHKKNGNKNLYIQFNAPIFFVEEIISGEFPVLPFLRSEFRDPVRNIDRVPPCKQGYLLALDKPPDTLALFPPFH